jgi:hypothetical protein
MKVISVTINAFEVRWLSPAVIQFMVSCTQRACFHSSAVPPPVVKSGAFEAPGGNHVVFNAADKPAEFDFIMQ